MHHQLFGGSAVATRRLFIPILLACLFMMTHGNVDAQSATGVISGVVQPPAGGTLPTGVEVELLFLPNGQGPPVITSQPLATDGVFRFENVDTAPQHRYLVRVTVNGEDNLSELLAFNLDETEKQVTIVLFAKTTDASALALSQVNYILDVQSSGWVVATLYRYVNQGDQIIENLTNPPAAIPLPADAINVQFAEGIDLQNIQESNTGFSYPGPFPPGDTVIVFSYSVPYQQGSQTLAIPFGNTPAPVRLLVPQLGQTTRADGLTLTGADTGIENRTFDRYESDGPLTVPVITFAFDNLPLPPTPAPTDSGGNTVTTPSPNVAPLSGFDRLPRWSAIIPMLIGIGGVLLYIAVRPEPSAAEQRAALRSRRDQLVAEVAMLDIRYETGAIGETTHNRQRAALKNELKSVIRRLGTDTVKND